MAKRTRQQAERGSRIGWVAAAAALTLGALLAPPGALDATADGEAGQAVFEAQKCATCHSVESMGVERKTKSEKMAGKDLSNIGAERERDWIAGYIKGETELEGAKHKKPFKGSDEELQSLLDFLMTLVQEEGAETAS